MSSQLDLSGLRSTDPEKLVEAKMHCLTRRQAVVKAAVDVLSDARDGKQPQEGGKLASNDPRGVAIQILTEYRASEAVNELLRIVDLKRGLVCITESRRLELGDYYPAANALAKIGRPAVRPVVWELTKEATPRRREILCWIVGEIEGPKVARWRIEEQVAELELQVKQAAADRQNPQPLQEKIERLRGAIRILEKLFPNATGGWGRSAAEPPVERACAPASGQ